MNAARNEGITVAEQQYKMHRSQGGGFDDGRFFGECSEREENGYPELRAFCRGIRQSD